MTATTSPTLRPMSARPTGDEFEIRPSAGFASVDPTIRYDDDLAVAVDLLDAHLRPEVDPAIRASAPR